jgi:hypothetical protein
VSDQLNAWMNQQRADNDAKRAADRSREAGLLNYAGDQRAKVAAGSYVRPAEWSGPPRSKLDDFVSREFRGIDPDAGEPAPSHLAAPGEWPEDEEAAVRSAAWASLPEDVQLAGLDVDGPGFPEAAERFAAAVVVARDEASRANADRMHRENMARDPDTYGRP